tara:strand:- start:5884 stop:6210 length:327 start_codon:yes stop_codon:yes gene_type:complete
MSPSIKENNWHQLYAAGISTPARVHIMSAIRTLSPDGTTPFTINQILEQKRSVGKIIHRSTITEALAKFRKLDKPLVKVVGGVQGTTRPHFLFELTEQGNHMAEILGW